MRHRKAGVKLGRTGSHRNAMFRNMVTSLLKHERIRTTDTKAKELRRWADHVVTLAKRGDLHARRQALSIVHDKAVVHKLFENAQELFGSRAGGYTRLIKVGRRPGDAALMTVVELVLPETEEKKKKKKDKAAKKKAPVTPAATKAAAADETAEAPAEAAPAEAEAAAEAPAEETAEPAEAQDEAPEEAAAEEAPAAGEDSGEAEEPAEEDKKEDKDA